MKTKALLGVAASLLVTNAFATPPICSVTSMGAMCHFYSWAACAQAIKGIDGQCVENPAAMQAPAPQVSAPRVYSPPQAIQNPNVMGSFMQGMQIGQMQRMQEQQYRERQAELEIQRIQAEAAAAQARPARYYLCPDLETNGDKYVKSDTYGLGCQPVP